MPPDRHAPTQETEPANARTGPETFPSSPDKPVVAAGGKLWTEDDQLLADQAVRELVVRGGMRVPCDDRGHWHANADEKRAHGVFSCTVCGGDGCTPCDGTGYLAYFLGDERDQPLDMWWIDNALPGQPPARAVIWAPRAPQG